MGEKKKDVAVTEFYDLLHSGCGIEGLVEGVLNSPKQQKFSKFLRTIIEEEEEIRKAGFKLRLYFMYDDENNTEQTNSEHL